jgi:hypothetical protein
VPSGTVATTTGITTAPAIGQGGGGVGDLILYNAPNENATAIMVIANGTPFNIVTPDPGSGFTLIEIPDGTTGFVMLPAGPVGPPVAPPPPVSSGGTTIVAPSTVNASGIFAQAVGNVRVRDRASINGARVAGIGWGAIVPVLGTNAERTWILVAAESAQGWVAVEWFTFVSGSLNQVPVVQ